MPQLSEGDLYELRGALLARIDYYGALLQSAGDVAGQVWQARLDVLHGVRQRLESALGMV